MKKRTLIASLFAGLTSLSVNANDLYLDVSPDAFHARIDATHATNNIQYSGAVLFTDDDGELISAGLWTKGQIGNNANLTGGIGAKIYGVSYESEDYFALALGGNIQYSFAEVPGLNLRASLYYAPSITVTNDVDNLSDISVEVSYDLFENGEVYGGLRQVQSDFENNGKHEIDDGLHAGIKIHF